MKDINRSLRQMHINSGEMHSDLEQKDRDDIMLRFESGQIDVLVATDIVSRGIDIDDIQMVINYDVPHDAEDYVHRIGRTARASAKGKSITFVSEEEQYKFKRIEDFLEKEITRLTVPAELGEAPAYNPTMYRHGKKQFGGKKGTFHRNRKPAQKTKKNIKPHKSQQ